jgi:hypothetical protein
MPTAVQSFLATTFGFNPARFNVLMAGFILQDFKEPDEFLVENSSPRQFIVH